jgi:hypothetical protein
MYAIKNVEVCSEYCVLRTNSIHILKYSLYE